MKIRYHLFLLKGNSLSLLLEGVTEKQFDNYTCEADNSMGKASVTFDLTGTYGLIDGLKD